ncbi:hypothetical protein LZ30DRAFT_92981 [Colletotrichum cereale]|nr:hypothetical protein LZ30DRAFT_92981 [Colletotrichum cereale]
MTLGRKCDRPMRYPRFRPMHCATSTSCSSRLFQTYPLVLVDTRWMATCTAAPAGQADCADDPVGQFPVVRGAPTGRQINPVASGQALRVATQFTQPTLNHLMKHKGGASPELATKKGHSKLVGVWRSPPFVPWRVLGAYQGLCIRRTLEQAADGLGASIGGSSSTHVCWLGLLKKSFNPVLFPGAKVSRDPAFSIEPCNIRSHLVYSVCLGDCWNHFHNFVPDWRPTSTTTSNSVSSWAAISTSISSLQ